jgi:hydroxyquinol 1,2-dioxygenase
MSKPSPASASVFPELTGDVIARMATTMEPRLRAVMTALIRHLHAFVRETALSQEEWLATISFLTRTGQMWVDIRSGRPTYTS